MNLLTAFLHVPLLLAQADTPDATPALAPDATPDSSAIFTSSMTINGHQATPEQMAMMKSFMLIGGLVGLVILVVGIIAMWKVYAKAGKPGWASIVPIYNWVVLLEIVGRPVWWLVLFLIPGVNLIIMLVVLYDLCKSFGYGVGFFLGLLFLSPIFVLILAFGGARYIGPGGNPAAGYPPATV